MGRFSVEVELANDWDVARAEAGQITEQEVRQVRLRGVVDSGAARLVIPESTAKQLGLLIDGSTQVRYADGRIATRSIARRVHLRYAGRQGIFNAIVEPARESALIGAIVMEDLDLLVDCTNQQLVPRDPNQIISEID
ncbi:MAG TPA: aspartyl protease family protein [Humisphaera sp.]|jgi:predicted aspartyl protease|nr:aspartyl protease family protein [Humisphaera sp.]